MNNQDFSKIINEAADIVGKTWPLYGFVTSNPLSGYEKSSFLSAIAEAKKQLGGSVLPNELMLSQALERGEIDLAVLKEMLAAANFDASPAVYLAQMQVQKEMSTANVNHKLDVLVTKWLSAFMDEGVAEWEMPYKTDGFYKAWRKLAIYDEDMGNIHLTEIPKTAEEAISLILAKYSPERHLEILKYHLAALPGWTGYIKIRLSENSVWQSKYPISLTDYLGVRLCIAQHIKAQVTPSQSSQTTAKNSLLELQYIWLQAWEKTWQHKMSVQLHQPTHQLKVASTGSKMPTAQMVFCIDTRSELIRRHIEAQGNYETFGYAGFFGLATDYKDVNTCLVRKSCPPIVGSSYTIVEEVNIGKSDEFVGYRKQKNYESFANFLSVRMKNMLPSAFGYVEGAGLFYGFKLMLRTFFPAYSANTKLYAKATHEHICEPSMEVNTAANGVSLAEKVAIVNSAFQLLGWKNFAPLVVFAGHGSHSSNNAFGSSLDCGACAASPGRHNARMLAKLANLPEVRVRLRQDFGIIIPADTHFLGAEHNTTTDEILIFDTNAPSTHQLAIQSLKADLKVVQQTAIKERLGLQKNGLETANHKANNWADTRPEWGLAKNAGFIVGPRSLTKDLNLGGRCFLHSYNWEMDENGTALESIMQGPMVVTQWINNHYYFSTVDNDQFGGGTKITHNVVGKFGVVQGNGGDLKAGLPLQSVNSADQEMYHQPLRLSVIIQSPVARIEQILEKNPNLKSLLQNNWIYLLVMDPQSDNQITKYENGKWTAMTETKQQVA